MNNKAIRISLAHSVLFLMACLINASCTRASRPTEDFLDTGTLQATRTLTDSEPSPTPSYTSEATTTPTSFPLTSSLPAGSELLTEDEYFFKFELVHPDIESGSTILLVANEGVIETLGDTTTLDYLTWDGHRGPILTMTSRFSGEEDKYIVEAYPSSNTTPWVWLHPRNISNSSIQLEEYFINLVDGEIWSLKPGCESSVQASMSAGYFALRCLEKPDLWYFVLLSDPTEVLERSLAGSTDEPLNSSPPILIGNWVNFYPEVLSDQACGGDLFDWNPICQDLPFWLGPISPNGRWFEVRTKDEIHPDQIGILPASCITKGTQCNPKLDVFSSHVAPLGSDRFMTDSAWLQESNGLLFIVEVDTDRTNQTSEYSEIWEYSLSSKSFVKKYNLNGAVNFRTPHFKFASPIWSPDAKNVVVNVGKTISLLNIETGELTPLTEGGILLGEITLP